MGNLEKVTKSSLLETGKDCFPPDGVLDKVFSLLSNARQRFSVEFVGDDASQPNLLIESNIVNKRLQIITINGDERGDIDFNSAGVVVLDESDENTSLKKIFKRHVTTGNASADHLTAKKKKSDPGNEEKDVYIAKVQLDFKPKRKFKFYRKKTMMLPKDGSECEMVL